jgi:hypothetical protein
MTAGIVRLISLFVAVMMVLEHAAFAQRPSPGEILFDDRTLSSATTEIMEMPYPKLAALKRMLSECDPDWLSKNEEIRHTCDVARTDYAIEFDSHSSLDGLINSVNLASALLRSNAATNRKNPDDGKMIMRLADITFRLRGAANARFEQLRTATSRPPQRP